jgi:hypothetical protein
VGEEDEFIVMHSLKRETKTPLQIVMMAAAVCLIAWSLSVHQTSAATVESRDVVSGTGHLPEIQAVLKSIRGKIIKTVIVTNDLGNKYLLVEVDYPDHILKAPHVDFYEIRDASDGRKIFDHVRTVRSLVFGSASISKLSGKPLGKAFPAIVIIDIDVGGNSPESSWHEYFVMEGDTSEFKVDWAGKLSAPRDIDGDGNVEFIIGRRAILDGCHPCWKDRQAVISLRDGKFVPVCKTFPSVIRSNIDFIKHFLEDTSYIPDWQNLTIREKDKMGYRLEVLAELAIGYAQIGENEEAQRYAREYVHDLGDPDHPILGTVIEAGKLAHLQCPVDAVLSDDPHWRTQ